MITALNIAKEEHLDDNGNSHRLRDHTNIPFLSHTTLPLKKNQQQEEPQYKFITSPLKATSLDEIKKTIPSMIFFCYKNKAVDSKIVLHILVEKYMCLGATWKKSADTKLVSKIMKKFIPPIGL